MELLVLCARQGGKDCATDPAMSAPMEMGSQQFAQPLARSMSVLLGKPSSSELEGRLCNNVLPGGISPQVSTSVRSCTASEQQSRWAGNSRSTSNMQPPLKMCALLPPCFIFHSNSNKG